MKIGRLPNQVRGTRPTVIPDWAAQACSFTSHWLKIHNP